MFLDFPSDRAAFSAPFSEGTKTLRSKKRKERKNQKSSLTSEEKVNKALGQFLRATPKPLGSCKRLSCSSPLAAPELR